MIKERRKLEPSTAIQEEELGASTQEENKDESKNSVGKDSSVKFYKFNKFFEFLQSSLLYSFLSWEKTQKALTVKIKIHV